MGDARRSRKLLILGASELQLPAIETARDMGLVVGVADMNPAAPGAALADEFFECSTYDAEAVAAVARDWRPDGIMTLATDWPMRSVAAACAELGLPAISVDCAARATDKLLMIRAFHEHGVPAPWFEVLDADADVEALAAELPYPCVVKPIDSSGSRGVTIVHDAAELPAAVAYSRAASRSSALLVEEYLQGPEVSVELLVVDGEPLLVTITDKSTSGPPHFIETMHSQPSALPAEVQREILAVAGAAIAAIGATTGAAHAEIIVTPDGPKMVEIGARMGGDRITTHMVPLSTGIDMTRAVIELALGGRPNLERTAARACVHRFLSAPEGVLAGIAGVAEARALPGVEGVFVSCAAGDRLVAPTSSGTRAGSVLVSAATLTAAHETAAAAAAVIRFDMEAAPRRENGAG